MQCQDASFDSRSNGVSVCAITRLIMMKVSIRFSSGCTILLLCLLAPAGLAAQCASAPQGEIRANPDRPTAADPADITEYGVLEIEYGWDHSWLGQ